MILPGQVSDGSASESRAQGTEVLKIENRLPFWIVEIQAMAPKHKDGDVVAVVRRCNDCNNFDNG